MVLSFFLPFPTPSNIKPLDASGASASGKVLIVWSKVSLRLLGYLFLVEACNSLKLITMHPFTKRLGAQWLVLYYLLFLTKRYYYLANGVIILCTLCMANDNTPIHREAMDAVASFLWFTILNKK